MVVARLVPVKWFVERAVFVLNDVVVALDVAFDVPNVVVVLNDVVVPCDVPYVVVVLNEVVVL